MDAATRAQTRWGGLWVLLALLAGQALAQPAPASAARNTADVIGIRPGMPLKDALAVAKAHNPKLVWHLSQGRFGLMPNVTFTMTAVGTEQGRLGSMAYTREEITIEAAPGPAPEVVTGVLRFVSFDGAEASRQKLVESLEQKYGAVFDPRWSNGNQRLWLFDADGKPLRHAEMCHTDFGARAGNGPGSANLGAMGAPEHFRKTVQQLALLQREAPKCGTLVSVVLHNTTQNKELVSGVSAYLSDEHFRTARFKAMAEHLQRLAQASERQQAGEAAQRPPPKF